MIKYKISYKFPHRHFIDFELSTKTNNQKKIVFQLPAWRPGRYELANFAQNIQKWQHRLTPGWKKIGGGCNLNRDIEALILSLIHI